MNIFLELQNGSADINYFKQIYHLAFEIIFWEMHATVISINIYVYNMKKKSWRKFKLYNLEGKCCNQLHETISNSNNINQKNCLSLNQSLDFQKKF